MVSYPDDIAVDYQDLAKINLSRIYVREKTRRRKRSNFLNLSIVTLIYKDSLYERFYITYRSGDNEYIIADSIIRDFPLSIETRELKLLLAQIQLRSGNIGRS